MADDDTMKVRMRDGGPLFVETPPDLDNYPGWAAEPWNTASAALFVIIALGWIWFLRGRYRQHPFLTICLPILMVGGIGGMLFHGTRTIRLFLLIDVVPIYLLGFAVTVWLWVRLGARLRHLLGVIVFLLVMQLLAQMQMPIQWAINISYATLAVLILLAVAFTLFRTRFRHAGWVYTACAFFSIAWICRISDTVRPPVLPMGTHWLWHVFGALTTLSLSVYVYQIEGVELGRRSPALDQEVKV
jgi:hypothetical protein